VPVLIRGAAAVLFTVFSAICIPQNQAFAWGEAGHKIVCEIAFQELDANARSRVKRAIDADPDYTAFADACIWADAIRSLDRYKRYDRLHYVNAKPGATSLPRRCPRGCVLSVIEEEANILRDPARPAARKLEALKFLGHFVGDLHQPLHASYAKDLGGNRVMVQYHGETENLHRVWDTLMIRQRTSNWRSLAEQLAARVAPGDRVTHGARSPLAWGNESFRIVESGVYDFENDEDLALGYYRRNIRTVEKRMLVAGIRLAALLNRVYGPSSGPLFE
jgi:hypothetical protein